MDEQLRPCGICEQPRTETRPCGTLGCPMSGLGTRITTGASHQTIDLKVTERSI